MPTVPAPQPPKPAATAAPKPPPLKPSEVPIGERPVEKPRADKRGLDDYLAETTPRVEAPPAERAPKAPEPPEDAPEAPPQDKPADSPSGASEGNPDETEGDLDSLIESVVPKPKPSPSPEDTNTNTPKGLRTAYETLKKEHDKLKSDFEKAKSGADEDLKKAFEELKAERDQLAEKLTYAAYTESPEYAEKFGRPAENAYADAIALVGRVKNAVTGTTGTAGDIQALYHLYSQDIAAATERAEELFGRAGDRIIAKIEQIDTAEKNRLMAVEDWRKNASARQTAHKLESDKHRKRILDVWQDQIRLERETRPDLFDNSKDPNLSSLQKRAEAFAELAFVPDNSMDEERLVRHQAKVRMLAAASIPLLSKLNTANKEIETLKAALAEYEGGKPKVKSTGEASKAEKKVGMAALSQYFEE